MAAQNVQAMFLTFADLGLKVGDVFNGYSILPPDAKVGGSSTNVNSYLNSAIYPNNSSTSGNGADISAINGYFINQNPLPVSLISFTGKAVDNQAVQLDWSTATERNNDHFLLERSKDLLSFEPVAQIKAKESQATQGNTNKYRYTDQTPFAGTSYYRLRQVDFDGTITSFPAISVVLRRDAYGTYPNPVQNGQFTLNLDEPQSALINLYNVDGRVVPLQKTGNTEGSVQLKATQKLPSGVYVLTVEERSQTRKYRVIVE